MKKVLLVATTPSMIGQFNMGNIEILKELGYEIHVACNFEDTSVWDPLHTKEFRSKLKKMNVICHQVFIERSPYNIKKNYCAFKQVLMLARKENYVFLHCHTPVAGIIGRVVGKMTKTKVIYTAHGFHFFSGAPLKNWIIFFPIERWLSKYTDILITINTEDYNRANKNFFAKSVKYIPGVGIETDKFATCDINIFEKRKSLKLPAEAQVLLSVGELHKRKNQIVVIEALIKLRRKDIFYLIVGNGKLKAKYEKIIKKNHMEDNIILLGFREDILELCHISNIFIHPSIREGLGIAPLEAMASGLPLITSNINGIKDYAKDRKTGLCVNPKSEKEMETAIRTMLANKKFMKKCSEYNKKASSFFDVKNTNKIMKMIYNDMERKN